jgi:arylsulfate sulfotransferase
MKQRKRLHRLLVGAAAWLAVAGLLIPLGQAQAVSAPPSIQGYAAGPTPFIANVTVANVSTNNLTSISFVIQPVSGSTTTPISATYHRQYFVDRPSLLGSGTITVPVYGLYASASIHSNQVTLVVTTSMAKTTLNATLDTTPWSDPVGGAFTSGLLVKSRNAAVHLGYSYFMLKSLSNGLYGAANPIVMDTDGQVRWVADSGVAGGVSPSTSFQHSFYVAIGPLLYRMDLDGTSALVRNFTGVDNTSILWHNIDLGKTGLLLNPDGPSNSNESTFFEVDSTGAILKTFDFYQIISEAMIAGGDDPSQFVSQGGDWFHSNAATYWPAHNELVVSSRENFVIAVNYDTERIDWILGDPTKQWHQFKSLRHFALSMPAGTLPPIGQHALSITPTGQLLLFDDGQGSFNHGPAGVTRYYSFPQMFQINLANRSATQTWAYFNSQPIWSNICSSVYQVGGNSYLIDYAAANNSPEIIGLGANNAVAFDFQFPNAGTCNPWNTEPVTLNGLVFAK